jgi:transcription factor TFIIIB component B''
MSPQCATSVPTVIATPTRAPPPILIQTNAPQSYSSELQAAMPINLPTRPDHCYTTLQVASPNHLSAGNADAFCFPISAAVMPSTEVAAPHMSSNQLSITQDQQEGSSTGLRRNTAVGDGSKKSKKRKASKTSDRDTEDEGPTSREAGSRGSSKTPRPGRRAPSMSSFDPNDHPGEDIDPTAMTMASLCVDTGQGRVSSKAADIMNNHAAWKLNNREKRARMKSIMETKKYGRLEDDVEENIGTSNQGEPSAAPSTTTLVTADDTGHGFDYTEGLSTSRFNVQVRIGPNGETIIDENSLVVDRTENNGTENFTHITESDYTKFVNSATYGKRFRGSRWSAEETDLFYDVGTFTSIFIFSI